MKTTTTTLGICIGASTIKTAAIDGQGRIVHSSATAHEGNPRQVLSDLLTSLDVGSYDYVAVTGRRMKEQVNLPQITEVEATEQALKQFLNNTTQRFNALISLGSENFILYELDRAGGIVNVRTGNKCASGTGEFFLQQIGRMDVSIDEAIALANGSAPYRVSGRCTVFCKSDCTHALNKGIPAGRICAGLGSMMAEKIVDLLKSVEKRDILVIGGVTRNSYVINKLRESVGNLVIPEHAEIFEAFGAALYALEHRTIPGYGPIIDGKKHSFAILPPLAGGEYPVTFMEHPKATARPADECLLGLDVGSTTTKAVLMRAGDAGIVASVYLRTNGNPVKAARECYRAIGEQVRGIDVNITGLGVTGSGRQIAGLHALTGGIVNEIIAHAAGAAYFDRNVDTIIEIGGQDAKYTHLVNGVPCDYAMNEACSAGTGSFLEEASKESLNIGYREIEELALRAKHPPNFNDQCAAFIGSDIKSAAQENIPREDIVAGLVYSICMNYNNRVKGARKLGETIFMQGGVCYNKAVPIAMAALLKKKIIVPPDPGLIGAFGAALEIRNRIELGAMSRSDFSLDELAGREAEYGKSFTCRGTKEGCDLGCQVNLIRIGHKNHAFGGICNKYYNIMHALPIDARGFDHVASRQELIFGRNGHAPDPAIPTVGMSKSFYTNILYPLYNTFFSQVGFRIVLGDRVDPDGTRMAGASFCFPGEIAHGMFQDLLQKKPDVIFLPHVEELPVEGSNGQGRGSRCTCVLAQSEPYYLRSAFREIGPEVLSPVLNFSEGLESMERKFLEIGKSLGVDKKRARTAFKAAVEKQQEFSLRKKEIGDRILDELAGDPSKIGIVVFGRSYNAFADEANLGIPRKFASRGVHVIPFDCLRFDREDAGENMNWATGQEIIKAARVVKNHPQLFGAYVTNFSCGPDSFLVGYFREIMNTKPSLTLELDSHSADAGINTRIEAFLDIIGRYRDLRIGDGPERPFTPARLATVNGSYRYIASDGKEYPIKDKRVRMILPSMGTISTGLLAAAFRGIGFNAEAAAAPDFHTLMRGRANTSCKECLPLILTTASLLEAVERRNDPDDLLLYFMPTAPGNCRFSQYYVFQKKLIEKQRLENVALLTLTAENSYAGMGTTDQITLLKALVTADAMDNIRNALLVLPVDKEKAEAVFAEQMQILETCFERNADNFEETLRKVARALARIELRFPLSEAKKVLLAGEIYVRKDEFCSEEVIRTLAKRDIVAKRSPILEWLYYVDYLVKNDPNRKFNWGEWLELTIRSLLRHSVERTIKKIFSTSGLFEEEMIDLEDIINTGSRLIDPAMTGEAIVVIGSFFHEMARNIHGLVSLGPFACMPTRVIESILSRESKVAGNTRLDAMEHIDLQKKFHTLPFLSIEADGNPFPQIVEARLEAFALQVERLHIMLNILIHQIDLP